MSSSTFEVTEGENETEKDLSFGLEACEENGIGLSAQVDGEIQKDHTYTKDPDDSDDEGEKPNDLQEEEDKTDALPEKRTTRNLKASKTVKKSSARNAKVKKEVSPKKEASPNKRARGKKEVLTEESNKSDDNAKPEKSDEKNDIEDQSSKSLRRGKKRKVEEKENVIDRSIVEEVQNINEGDVTTESNVETPAKKKNATPDKKKTKKTPKTTSDVEDVEDNQNLPKGWVRKEVVRKSGKTAGQVDIYIYSPDGIKFRSRPDIAAYLARTKSNLKLEDFNFSKKKASEDSVVKATTPKKEKPVPAAKPKNTPEKKKAQLPTTPKKGSKLLVKLSFSPKSKRGRNVKKPSDDKQTKETKSPVKKGKASSTSSKTSKKKTA